jgi:hypothetical protein
MTEIVLYVFFKRFDADFQFLRPEHHRRDIICQTANLVHQNWYHMKFTYAKICSMHEKFLKARAPPTNKFMLQECLEFRLQTVFYKFYGSVHLNLPLAWWLGQLLYDVYLLGHFWYFDFDKRSIRLYLASTWWGYWTHGGCNGLTISRHPIHRCRQFYQYNKNIWEIAKPQPASEATGWQGVLQIYSNSLILQLQSPEIMSWVLKTFVTLHLPQSCAFFLHFFTSYCYFRHCQFRVMSHFLQAWSRRFT